MQNQRIIEVVPYNPQWVQVFQKESQIIMQILTNEIVHIHHIGSTSVPGLHAKPIIDILLEVRNTKILDSYDSEMEKIEYIPKGEFGICGRRLYIKGIYKRTHHIHAFNTGSHNVTRHLAFRDYLIQHPNIAQEYAKLKQKCANECNNNNEIYCDGKHDFVTKHEKMALQWQETRNNRPK